MPTKKWTEEEEEFLKANYMEMSNTDLAEKFDITKNAVQKKLARMALKRSKAAKKPAPAKAPEAETVEEKEPEVVSTESHFFLGSKSFYEDRDYEQAIEEYRQAAKKESDELIRLRARYWMAESHVKIGNVKEAMNILKKLAEERQGHYLGDSARRRMEALTEYIVPVT
jgi:TolA-binding protein